MHTTSKQVIHFMLLMAIAVVALMYGCSDTLKKVVQPKGDFSYRINDVKCNRCDICFKECPSNAIQKKFIESSVGKQMRGTNRQTDSIYIIDMTLCIYCGKCPKICPVNAIDQLEVKN
ncbi:MAG: 4Fe-4S binding protein [Chitinivibrionales bacterium]|nr:4Fe-4S binding protein [Chitinivibrionales bacterium]